MYSFNEVWFTSNNKLVLLDKRTAEKGYHGLFARTIPIIVRSLKLNPGFSSLLHECFKHCLMIRIVSFKTG